MPSLKTGWINLPSTSGGHYDFDPTSGLLFVASGKSVLRYDLSAESFLDAIELGVKVGGLSLTEDGQTLYAAKAGANFVRQELGETVSSQSIFEIDTATGDSARFSHQVTGLERGVRDVAVAANGKVLSISEPHQFSSGAMPLWRLDPDTDSFDKLEDDDSRIASESHILASETGGHLLVMQGFSSAEMNIYSAAEDKLIGKIESFDYGFQLGNITDSVDISSTAELIAAEAYKGRILGFDGSIKANLSSYGLESYAFSTDGTMLYGYDAATRRVFGFDTDDWSLQVAYLLDLYFDDLDENFRLTPLDSDGAGVLFFEDKGTGALATLDLAEAAQTRFFTDAAETINGAAGTDILDGEGGDDVIRGNKGADGLFGRSGGDNLFGGRGHDYLRGNGGNDTLIGGTGRDTLMGDDGRDRLFGGDQRDALFGGGGDDFLKGGDGDDRLLGGNKKDDLRGEDGDDLLFGGRSDDRLVGGDGDDALVGGFGDDGLFGHTGNDSLFGGGGDDKAFGGNGEDTVDGGAGNDSLLGENGDDRLVGGRGEDRLEGGAGTDTLLAGGQSDRLYGGWQADLLNGQSGDDILFGGGGADSLYGAAGRDFLIGDRGNDALFGGADIDILTGWIGDDDLTGGGGSDLFIFEPLPGHNTIHDFQNGLDVLTFQTPSGILTFDDFDEVRALARDVGLDMRIDLSDDQSVLIKDFSRSDFDETDVYFGLVF